MMRDIRPYSVDGQIAFPIRGSTGGLATSRIIYLIYQAEKTYVYGVEYSYSASDHELALAVINGMKEFDQQLEAGTARIADMQGGDLGRGDNLISKKG